ncbi:response regulator [Alicyclobacillus acidoterrestris]|uniref:response regulator n=1 Tax=Alicyclobacillus acidoterrestris TaxID=1450 RepID=UPI003F52A976
MTERTHPPFLVAVVEDDHQLASTLARQLARYEFEPVLLDCRQDIARAVDDISPHIVLLDINLPKYDGFYWCRRIRESSVAPIIFVSARNAGMDQVFALENGGDDYVVKPFDMEVLVAKLRAQIRRSYGAYANAPDVVRDAMDESLVFGPFELNVRKMQVGFQGHWTALAPASRTHSMGFCSHSISIMGFALHYLRRRRLLSAVTRQLVQSNLPLDAADSLRRYATAAEHLCIIQLLESYLATYREDLQQVESKRLFYEHFTTRFAHQMKTPLTVLRLLTKELLVDAVQRDTEAAQYALTPTIDEMQAELTKLETALDTMLYTARLQSFSFDVRMVRLPLAPLLRQVINEHKASWIRQKIYPRLDVPGHLEVTSDEKWLRFICDQIVRNALQYGYKVDASGLATSEPATFVIAATEGDELTRVTFRDEGIGMHPRDLRRMFEPFYTGENGRSHSRATGMGLGEPGAQVRALDGVDFAIEPGEFVAIMGPSGSGKTTLLNILAGLDKPTGGQLVIDGQSVETLSGDALALFRRRKLGFVFQDFNLLDTLTLAASTEAGHANRSFRRFCTRCRCWR